MRNLLLSLSILALTAGQGLAQASAFEPAGNYQLIVADEVDAAARIYQSQQLSAVLVVSDRLPSPVLLHARTQRVQAVPLLRLSPQAGGGIELQRGDELVSLGTFTIGDDGIVFSHGAVQGKVAAKPPVVGDTDLAGLIQHSPEYRSLADAYRPSASTIKKLREVGEGYRVQVVFGSWCHVCSVYLPRGLRVEEELAGSKIEFDYIGLETNPWQGPVVKKYEVVSLPTAIVYRGNVEVGRFFGADGWERPEDRILRAIESPTSGE